MKNIPLKSTRCSGHSP